MLNTHRAQCIIQAQERDIASRAYWDPPPFPSDSRPGSLPTMHIKRVFQATLRIESKL
ncbi:hypothetical protein CHLRE_29g757847v5 [Chlamydomonas reinhardtii]|uniref:Uncharacterized protein n=1 Tax=Chlamydomonas reinhardtii TaxID=3055 RepID=A0A2K3CMZ7_CHLRE|nr:uncharacterized protein CHLRE_29g757847v5 [Chlamydomonas reinhardtii]PNW69648.1 hypothetical protein CHLRE_29g757847v5 [Chlamydomonas reinhardtii]